MSKTSFLMATIARMLVFDAVPYGEHTVSTTVSLVSLVIERTAPPRSVVVTEVLWSQVRVVAVVVVVPSDSSPPRS